MLGSLSLISVRQQADAAKHGQRSAYARRDERVEHHLRSIAKIAELSFPQGEGARLAGAIAVLKTQVGLLGEHRIEHFVAPLRTTEMIERGVTLFGILIEQDRVTL